MIEWLDSRENHEHGQEPGAARSSWGLGRMRRLLQLLGSPHAAVPVVHVAGTKGKGSTVAMLAAMLRASGYREGCYLSPHVERVEERICVGGRPIPSRDLVRAWQRVLPAVESMDRSAARRGGKGPTWFEIMTAMAFDHFARQSLAVVVLETGLGGRLDATNVVRPLLSVITSIGLDHMDLLGRTVGRIATEKAGIIKRSRPVVSGAVQPAARRSIREVATARRSRLLEIGRDFSYRCRPVAEIAKNRFSPRQYEVEVRLPPEAGLPDAGGREVSRLRAVVGMPGRHQAANAAVAIVAAGLLGPLGFPVSAAACRRGLAGPRLPARMEQVAVKPVIVIDAAHNTASMQALVATLMEAGGSRSGRRVLLFAASRDKPAAEMLAEAARWAERIVLTGYAGRRASDPRRLLEAIAAGGPPAEVVENSAEGLHRARQLAGAGGVVCVAGSFFLASEVRGLLEAVEER
jgi:dihydrofolate synthase / folylpolyglutamate synthase